MTKGKTTTAKRLHGAFEGGGESLAVAFDAQDTLRDCRVIAEKVLYDHGDMRDWYLAELVEKLTGRRPW